MIYIYRVYIFKANSKTQSSTIHFIEDAGNSLGATVASYISTHQ